jgi:hypothetical protein
MTSISEVDRTVEAGTPKGLLVLHLVAYISSFSLLQIIRTVHQLLLQLIVFLYNLLNTVNMVKAGGYPCTISG